MSMFFIPDIREGNLICCTRSLPRNNIEIIRAFCKGHQLNIPKQLEKRWNFPHCFGAIVGKHIAIRKRDGSSRYLNYKMTRLRVAVSRF